MAYFNYNKVILGGRLTQDPELRTTPSGVPVCSFFVAVNRRTNKGDAADFFRCAAWYKTAEFVSRYFAKGSSICLEGSLQTKSWVSEETGEKRFVTEIVADEVFFVDAKAEMPQASRDSRMARTLGGQAVVTPDSEIMQGYDGSTEVPAARESSADASRPGMYMTPGARAEIEAEGDFPSEY